jgi:hypothetical protein
MVTIRLAVSVTRCVIIRGMCSAPQPLLAATNCFRPTPDDVEAVSRGLPAKHRGTGSRGVPHRLNSEERMLFDLARRKGWIELTQGLRRTTQGGNPDSPLRNTYRSWCDSQGVAAIFVHKQVNCVPFSWPGDGLLPLYTLRDYVALFLVGRQGRSDKLDEVVVDLSPLRAPANFAAATQIILSAVPAGVVAMGWSGRGLLNTPPSLSPAQNADSAEPLREAEDAVPNEELAAEITRLGDEVRALKAEKADGVVIKAAVAALLSAKAKAKASASASASAAYEQEMAEVVGSTVSHAGTAQRSTAQPKPKSETKDVDEHRTAPIHRLPMCTIGWARPRGEAKALARFLASLLGTAPPKHKREAFKTTGDDDDDDDDTEVDDSDGIDHRF